MDFAAADELVLNCDATPTEANEGNEELEGDGNHNVTCSEPVTAEWSFPLGRPLSAGATLASFPLFSSVSTRTDTAEGPQRAPAFQGILMPLHKMLSGPEPILALAPMQDITNLALWKLMASYGGADLYVTEFFRVHSTSRLDKDILRSITENPTGRPVVGQLIGNDIPALVRSARELQNYPVAAVDFNMGCPAPIVYKKCAGGGLLRDLRRADAILGALREAVRIPFTIKARVGFHSGEVFDEFLAICARHAPDLVTIHGRTVLQLNRGPVRYDLIERAARALACPVLANGNVHSAARALEVLRRTSTHGLMIGRGALRNPWIFEQIRQALRGEPVRLPVGRQVLGYLHALWEHLLPPHFSERLMAQMMKKFTNYLGEAVDPEGRFLHQIRRVETKADFFKVAADFLDHEQPMDLVPFAEAALNFGPPSAEL